MVNFIYFIEHFLYCMYYELVFLHDCAPPVFTANAVQQLRYQLMVLTAARQQPDVQRLPLGAQVT
jgi:hypothetical protein